MEAPRVYSAIASVAADLADRGVPKRHRNEADGFDYRSVDDILTTLAPLLAKHRLCVLPKAVERHVDRAVAGSAKATKVVLRVAYELASAEDGSTHVLEVFGEASDEADKATAKAMSAAFKTAMIQTFCIPVVGADEPDAAAPSVNLKTHLPEPIQGWCPWSLDIIDIVSVCEAEEALESVQERNREMLKALSRERPELYEEVGRAFTARREGLNPMRAPKKATQRAPKPPAARDSREGPRRQRQHA